jgi:hypothetical protein
MSDRYPLIKIGDIFLTSDGTIDGARCRARVENESAFASQYAINSTEALDFTVHSQVAARELRAISFSILCEFHSEAVLASVLTLLNASLASLSDVRIVVTSLTDFDAMARPVLQAGGALFSYESRSGGIAKGVRFNFISTGAGE